MIATDQHAWFLTRRCAVHFHVSQNWILNTHFSTHWRLYWLTEVSQAHILISVIWLTDWPVDRLSQALSLTVTGALPDFCKRIQTVEKSKRKLLLSVVGFCTKHEMKWNKSASILSAFENRLRAGLVYNTMQTNPLSRIKTWSESLESVR